MVDMEIFLLFERHIQARKAHKWQMEVYDVTTFHIVRKPLNFTQPNFHKQSFLFKTYLTMLSVVGASVNSRMDSE